MRRLSLWIAAAVVALGGEWAGYGFSDPADWLPDLAAGVALLAGGLVAWERRPDVTTGPLLAASGVAWFAGGIWSPALFLHRGPLTHAMLAFPGARPARRLDAAAIAAGYALAAIAPAGRSAGVTIAWGAGLAAVALSARAPGRHAAAARGPGPYAAAAFGLSLAACALARLAGASDEPILLAYECVVLVLAVALAAAAAARPWERVTDLVVELASAPPGTLRDALARALGDPTLEVGYAVPGGFADEAGRRLGEPPPGRALTLVERGGEPVAALVHDAGVLDDPRLVRAISDAARLAAANARLQAEVREQIADLEASRARLLAVAGAERAQLERRLREGAEARLTRIAALLEQEGASDSRAAEVLEQARADLRALAHGLVPRPLAEALAPLAGASGVPVELDVAADGVGPEASAVAYFVCAEALANVSKHARARRVAIGVRTNGASLAVEVADDGAGGADPAAGSGLRGLAERVQACGGTLTVHSPPGRGTRVAATIPLD